MFSLHETTRKRTCRTAFLLLCIVPTLLTVAWVANFHRPGRCSDFQRDLSRRLHLAATVGRHECPRPGLVRLSNVQLHDLRWNKHLATIDELRIQQQGGRLLLTVAGAELQFAQLSTLATALESWLADSDPTPVQLQLEQLTLVRHAAHGEPLELTNLRAGSELTDDGMPRVWIQADLLDREKSSTVQLVVDRVVVKGTPLVRASLDTQGVPIPAWLLSDVVPGCRRYGEGRWQGTAQLQHTVGQLSGTLQGTLAGLELQQLIGTNAGHTLRGIATLTLDSMQWQDGRVEQVQGQLRADGGTVNRSLLMAAVRQLFCSTGGATQTEKVSFDSLACDFQLSEAGITLEGTADGHPGCLLVRDGQALLMQPRFVELPVAQLVQMLSPPSRTWLPATLEAQHLTNLLPLPRAEKKIEMATRPDRDAVRSY